ncbi:MAG: hypothetical protein ACPK7O_00675 [Methanobacterium sp.]
MKDRKSQCDDEVCHTGASKCSVTWIWLGVAVICFVMAIAFYLSN